MNLKIFVPFSRLTYSISMSEMLFIWYDLTNSHQYFPVDGYNMAMRVTYIFTMCTILGYFVYLLFEAPAVNLLKLFRSNMIKDSKKLETVVNMDQTMIKSHKNGKIE